MRSTNGKGDNHVRLHNKSTRDRSGSFYRNCDGSHLRFWNGRYRESSCFSRIIHEMSGQGSPTAISPGNPLLAAAKVGALSGECSLPQLPRPDSAILAGDTPCLHGIIQVLRD